MEALKLLAFLPAVLLVAAIARDFYRNRRENR